MPRKKTDFPTCFYCDAVVVRGGYENDHFPVPKSCGGTETVVACITCHSLKDRINFRDWNTELWVEVIANIPRLGRGMRIIFAKMLSVTLNAQQVYGDEPK